MLCCWQICACHACGDATGIRSGTRSCGCKSATAPIAVAPRASVQRQAGRKALFGTLQKRDLKLILKGRDGACLGGKRGFQVSDGLCFRLTGKRQVGWAALGQSSAYVALAVHKTLPDSVGRRDAEIELCGAQCFRRIAQTDHKFEECPQALRTEAQAPEFIGGPHAEGVPAAVVVFFTIVAKDPPAATRLLIVVVFGIAEQRTVENQRSGCFAGRTMRQFQAMIQA